MPEVPPSSWLLEMEGAICKRLEEDRFLQKLVNIQILFWQTKASSEEFRQPYRSFYGMNAARVGKVFANRYFELLDQVRGGKPDIPILIERLRHAVPGRQKIYFSFMTKLLATIDPARSIYDKHVRIFFRLPIPVAPTWGKRLNRYTQNYRYIENGMCEMLSRNEIINLIGRVRARFPSLPWNPPDQRLLDLLIYTRGKILRGGAH